MGEQACGMDQVCPDCGALAESTTASCPRCGRARDRVAPLEARPLGDTGLCVTPIGLGLAALGRPGYLNIGHGEDLVRTAGEQRTVEAMERHTHDVLDAAYALGIRYLDAARSYGRAEEFLASWADARPEAAAAVTVGSKWGYTYTAGWQVDAEHHEVKDHGLATFQRQIVETRDRLHAHLDLYQVHSATLDSGVLDDRGVLAALAELGDGGTVVGLSLSGPQQADTLRRALEVEVDGTNPFGCVQVTWNLLEPSVGPALAEAHEAGWGVIVKEAVANGRLTPRGDAPQVVQEVAGRHGVGVDAVALAAALHQPFVDVVLSGATTVAQLTSNVEAVRLRLTEEDREAIGAVARDPETYWVERGALDWT